MTVGLEPTLLTALRLFGQVRNTRLASLTLAILVYSPRFRLALSPTGRASALRPNRCERCALPTEPCHHNHKLIGGTDPGNLIGGKFTIKIEDLQDGKQGTWGSGNAREALISMPIGGSRSRSEWVTPKIFRARDKVFWARNWWQSTLVLPYQLSQRTTFDVSTTSFDHVVCFHQKPQDIV